MRRFVDLILLASFVDYFSLARAGIVEQLLAPVRETLIGYLLGIAAVCWCSLNLLALVFALYAEGGEGDDAPLRLDPYG
ncbi:hypothetical protein [Mycobacterium spongiae]|uniref:Uncharacterized protein n=1 Tax=Mycobacterium spongiae TaxID=886343 RepID=A0A975K249_9MYCO|nr:hypothetical protein [Mycobacterium spongiae]QUR68723.1 hypothetical protein F6B93_18050 [Mycobacterium spongiae]